MILATKKRLQLLFALGVAGANLTILALIFFYLHQSIFNGLVEHIADHAHNEFRDIYLERSLEDIGLVDEDEIFQVYSLQGQLVAQTLNSTNFHLALNRSLLQEAGQGKESFQKVVLDELEYIEYYFPLSEVHVGRLVESIPQLEQFETNMIRVVAFSLPGVLLLSIFLARWLVNLAMKPITLAYQYQDNFSSNLTHELHSPLTSLKGNLEVALRKSRSQEEYQDVLLLSLNEAGRIIALLNDLHLLASSSFSPLSLEKSTLDLGLMIQGILDNYEPLFEEQGIKLQAQGLTGLQGRFDAHLLERALTNLIGNAVKYTTPGGLFRIRAEATGKQCHIELANDAAVISQADLKRIFEPFHRAANLPEGATGKGLGLNIDNYIFHSHGGSLQADYQEGLFVLVAKLPL